MRLELSPQLAAILFDAIEDAEYYRDVESPDERDEYDTERLRQYARLREAITRAGV